TYLRIALYGDLSLQRGLEHSGSLSNRRGCVLGRSLALTNIRRASAPEAAARAPRNYRARSLSLSLPSWTATPSQTPPTAPSSTTATRKTRSAHARSRQPTVLRVRRLDTSARKATAAAHRTATASATINTLAVTLTNRSYPQRGHVVGAGADGAAQRPGHA